jgi:hypothetical protein
VVYDEGDLPQRAEHSLSQCDQGLFDEEPVDQIAFGTVDFLPEVKGGGS